MNFLNLQYYLVYLSLIYALQNNKEPSDPFLFLVICILVKQGSFLYP